MKYAKVILAVSAVMVMAGAASADIDINGMGSYATIQDAIDAANTPGDTINVSAGTYDEVLSINKPINLIGAGAGSTTLTYTGAASEQLIFLGTNSGATINGSVNIEGFTLRHDAGLTGDNNLIKLRASSVGGLISIQNNIFDQNGTDITAIEESQGAGNFLIDNNQFNSRYAIWLNSAHDGTISGNTLTGSRIGMGGNGAEGYGPRDMAVTGNTIDGASYGLVLANNIERIAFTQNDILNSTAAGVLYWDYGTYKEWDDVVFNYNNIVGNAAGFAGYTTNTLPTLVDGTTNWWGDPSGPSGGFVDPVTGTPANGTGDLIALHNLAFDAWANAPDPVPVPGAMVLGVIGIGMVGAYTRKRRQTDVAKA